MTLIRQLSDVLTVPQDSIAPRRSSTFSAETLCVCYLAHAVLSYTMSDLGMTYDKEMLNFYVLIMVNTYYTSLEKQIKS